MQNEVSSLYLSERYCPALPAPRVFAWCDTGVEGDEIQVIRRSESVSAAGSGMEIDVVKHPEGDEGSCESGWLLMTRRPGRVLNPDSDLVGEAGHRIMKELARLVAQMRRDIPSADRVGNLRSSEPESCFGVLPGVGDKMRMEIKGLLNCTHVSDKSIHSAQEYHQIRLQDKLAVVRTEDVFAPQRERLLRVVKHFLTNDLPGLQLFQKQPAPPTFIFTNYDFSPRNILVSGTPPTVTGLLDFEFAGFFPPEEDFANNAVCNEGNWPGDAYEVFLGDLERLGVETPAKGFAERVWRAAMLLMELIEMWLHSGYARVIVWKRERC